jgi:hypothetical protein
MYILNGHRAGLGQIVDLVVLVDPITGGVVLFNYLHHHKKCAKGTKQGHGKHWKHCFPLCGKGMLPIYPHKKKKHFWQKSKQQQYQCVPSHNPHATPSPAVTPEEEEILVKEHKEKLYENLRHGDPCELEAHIGVAHEAPVVEMPKLAAMSGFGAAHPMGKFDIHSHECLPAAEWDKKYLRVEVKELIKEVPIAPVEPPPPPPSSLPIPLILGGIGIAVVALVLVMGKGKK